MQRTEFDEALQAHLVPSAEKSGEKPTWTFVPPSLPPDLPNVTWDFTVRIIEAERAISELKGLAVTLPNPYLLSNAFTRREATLSSKIEGTQSGLRELLLFEVGDEAAQKTDAREISNYVKAMQHGLDRLREIPLCLNVMLEMHEILLAGDVRGADKSPGRFRRGPVWVGGGGSVERATFVPPPWNEVLPAMKALEQFIHASSPLPFLARVACVHYQFEAIHPFLDGNGRIGRLLIPLMLCEQGLLEQPLLYLSAFFERRRSDYYDRLLRVSQRGEWMEWIEFFLQGVTEEGRDGVRRAKRLLELREEFQIRLESRKATNAAVRVLDSLFSTPVLSLPKVSKKLNLSYNATQSAIQKLEELGIVQEISGRRRNRLYVATEILEIIQA